MISILTRYQGNMPFSVQERDIDLLLIEQLHVSTAFADWLVSRLDLDGAIFETARHSVHRQHGETDVLVTVSMNGKTIALMIEDKIGAPMQPEQCERYHLRGRVLCDEGTVESYKTVLCAPATYLAGVSSEKPWDYRISLEELAHRIKEIAHPSWEWRQAILFAAASRLSRAREADNKSNHAYDAIIAPLKRAYRDYVQANFPQLIASPQEGRDREYYIKGLGLPAGIRFKHAFFRGEVSLIFEKVWALAAERVLANRLPEEAWPVRHGSEFHIRLPVEVMDPLMPFNEQKEVAEQALERIVSMMDWAQEVSTADLSGR